MNIVILGAGFAGLAAARKMSGLKGVRILLFDKNRFTTMIPSLPDLAGGKIPSNYLKGDIERIIPRKVHFYNEEIVSINLNKKTVHSSINQYLYDYLLIATGSIPNFHGFDQNVEDLYPLTSLKEAEKIKSDFPRYLKETPEPHLVLSGAGYTALELAGNLAAVAKKSAVQLRVSLVEKQDTILPFLSPMQKAQLEQYIATMNFVLKTGEAIQTFEGKNVKLQSGEEYKNVFLCWTAGTRFSIPEIIGKIERIPDGRIKVNEFLQVTGYPHVFVAGDSAAISHQGHHLRKAVNFAVYSGAKAGKNIIQSSKYQPLKPFHPFDLGWIIPLHNDSIGLIGEKISVKGKTGLRLHYFMCGYRNFNLKNKLKYFGYAMKLPQ